MVDAIVTAVDVEIPVNVQQRDSEAFDQEFLHPVCASLWVVVREVQGVELGPVASGKDNATHLLTDHRSQSLWKLFFVQREAFPDFYGRGSVIQSNDKEFQVLSGGIFSVGSVHKSAFRIRWADRSRELMMMEDRGNNLQRAGILGWKAVKIYKNLLNTVNLLSNK
tara:strand:- start:305 stop:802 length:498 start_codon:yes stop_codon:yes gene_type:complete